MPVTLAALVHQPALGLAVLASSHALDREISWVHTSELVDPTPYLTGGELLLSVGLWLGSGSAADRHAGAHVTAYVDRLVQAHVAALGFGVGVAHDAVPAPLVEAAAARCLPLIQVPEETAFIAISRIVWEVLAADQYAELSRTFQAQQELTRAAVSSGAAGLVRRLAERLDGWALMLDAAGSIEHAAPAGAARQGPWLAQELERLRDVATPVSVTLSVDGDQIVVQSLRPGHRTRGFLAVGISHRPTQEQRNVLNTAVSLLTLMLAQATALRAAESHLRTTIFDLLVGGELDRADRLARDLWGGLPAEPVRMLLVAGVLRSAARSSGDRLLRRRSDPGPCPGGGLVGSARHRRVGRSRSGRTHPRPAGGRPGPAGGPADRPAVHLFRRDRRRRALRAARDPAGRRVRRVAAASRDRPRRDRTGRPAPVAGRLARAQRPVGRGRGRSRSAPAHPAAPDAPGK